MNRLFFVFVLCSLALPASAQDAPVYLSSRTQPVQVSLGAWYQSYTRDDVKLSETSVPLFFSAPMGRHFGLTIQASQASASSDSLASLSGISDVQVGLSYLRELNEGSVMVSLGVNLPSGKRELTTEEFETAVVLSQHYFSFYVPGFGQGFNLSPGVVWALPLNDDLVLGLGAAYQYRGSYRPHETGGDYDPGDEITVTGGLDYRLSETANLSADVSYTYYGKDELDEETVFERGNKLTLTGQWLRYLGYREVRVLARFRSLAKSTLPATDVSAAQELRALPQQFQLRATYRHPVSRVFALGVLVQGRFLGETTQFDNAALFDLGLLPELIFSERGRLRSRLGYTLGDFNGFEVGAALGVSL